jgi:ribonuclease D
VQWRTDVARRADKATFRVLGNEPLLALAKLKPATRDGLAAVKGMPRGLLERSATELLDAVRRGAEVPESQLPRFPKAARWSRDPDFDSRATALRTARDAAAQRLDLDPGVLCSRDRLEAVARRNPPSMEELEKVPELRRWQVATLGEDFLGALATHRRVSSEANPSRSSSPYRDE